jgi:DNA-binding HxlR family transcriptional regulator
VTVQQPITAARRRTNPVSDCPMTAAIAAVGGRWKMLIISWLGEGPQHFAGLRRLIPQISQKVLTEQLRELMADDIVVRQTTGEPPAPVIYSLTDYGWSLHPIVVDLRRWGRGHIERFGP